MLSAWTEKTFERDALQLLPRLKNGDLELDLFIYQLLIEYYTNQEDLPSLCRCQSELIEFLCQQ